ncbi:MAG TPA: hypothetical protein VFW20_05595, partial [Candidatus Limnocylindrales bacterium]|nr:hypothetical protein [Candidatus Limnocylindrales bacterium]
MPTVVSSPKATGFGRRQYLIGGGIVLAVLVVASTALGLGKGSGSPSPAPSALLAFKPSIAPTVRPTPTVGPTPTPYVGPTVEPTPVPTPTDVPLPPTTYSKLTSRQWAQLVKAPDQYIGNGYQIWACITQFDAATGDDSFRGQGYYAKTDYWYLNGANVLFTGDAAQLAPYVENDIVFMK